MKKSPTQNLRGISKNVGRTIIEFVVIHTQRYLCDCANGINSLKWRSNLECFAVSHNRLFLNELNTTETVL